MVLRVGVRTLVSLLAVIVTGVALHSQQGGPSDAGSRSAVTKAVWEDWMANRTNWGRWGKDDQLGALNLITPEKRKAAIALATTGTTVSLAHRPALSPRTPEWGPYLDIDPLRGGGFAQEHLQMMYHGLSFTHIDALCHASHNDAFYNGYTASEVMSETGCSKLSIDNLAGGIVTRGIVIDIPYLKGVEALPPGTHVYPEDIEAFEEMAGISIGSGDAIFLHTGRWSRPEATLEGTSGYDLSVAPWLKGRDVAIVGGDGGQDVGQIEGLAVPLHKYIIVALGANIIDAADLQAAVEAARRLKRWEFMLTVLPVAVPHATGFPVNPIAVF